METGGEGYYLHVIDNTKRRQDLALVQQAETAQDLLIAACEHFDQSVLSLTTEQILEQFPDEALSPMLAETEGFDPIMYKAVMLFELSHLSEDEAQIPHLMRSSVNFWRQPPEHLSPRELERSFTGQTKRSNYNPFWFYSQWITSSLVGQKIDDNMESLRKDKLPEDQDPLGKEIDGDNRKWRLKLGDYEVPPAEEHPVLTRQFVKDLKKLYPRLVVDELQFRFPEDGKFEDIYPFIETIQYERANGVIPPVQELVVGLERFQKDSERIFGRRLRSLEDDKQTQEELALRHWERTFRNNNLLLHTRDIYVVDLGQWFTIEQLESDTEAGVSYRRVFYGDEAMQDKTEVSLEDRRPVLDELAEERELHSKEGFPFEYWDNPGIKDVYGEFEAR